MLCKLITGIPLRIIKAGAAASQSLQKLYLGNNPITPDEALFITEILTLNFESPIEFIDLENVFVNKKFLLPLKTIRLLGKDIKYESVLSNYKIKGPDIRKIYFERIKLLAMKPKKKKLRIDFGHFMYFIPEAPVTKQEFLGLIKKFKIKKLDKDLVEGLMKLFPAKDSKVDCVKMKAAYLERYPDTKPPEPPKKKKKKGRKKKKKKAKGKGKVSTEGTATDATGTATELTGQAGATVPGETTEGKVTVEGETTAGETTAGETSAGETTARDTTAGGATAGETTAGETTARETTAGETTAGETTGETTAGETTAGETTAGETTAGETDGETTGGETTATETDTEATPREGETPLAGEDNVEKPAGDTEGAELTQEQEHVSQTLFDEAEPGADDQQKSSKTDLAPDQNAAAGDIAVEGEPPKSEETPKPDGTEDSTIQKTEVPATEQTEAPISEKTDIRTTETIEPPTTEQAEVTDNEPPEAPNENTAQAPESKGHKKGGKKKK